MTTPPGEYKVGYGHPPLQTRWKNGQSSNRSKKRKQQESVVELIDSLFLKQVKLSLNGETKSVSALEAIISQLQVKEMSGNRRATRILLRYREFANQHADRRLDVIFVNDRDGRAVPDVPVGNDNG